MRNSILIENIMFKLFCVENSEGLKIFTETINSVRVVAKRFLSRRKWFVKITGDKKVKILKWLAKNNVKNIVAENFRFST